MARHLGVKLGKCNSAPLVNAAPMSDSLSLGSSPDHMWLLGSGPKEFSLEAEFEVHQWTRGTSWSMAFGSGSSVRLERCAAQMWHGFCWPTRDVTNNQSL